MKPFRFAVQASNASSAAEWRDTAKAAEDLGYATLHLSDHYFGPGAVADASRNAAQDLAAIPAMAAAAAYTSTLRVGCRVFCVDYHLPAVLAKSAATLDLLSDGRLELGLGAGWIAAEYEAMGLTMDPAGTRIERLGEVIDLLDAHYSGETIELDGQHVKVHGYSGSPLPVQRPRPRLMIGGGSKRVLTLAGQRADIVSLNFDNREGAIGARGISSGTAAGTADKVAWAKAGAGDRWEHIELEIGGYFTAVTDDTAGTLEAMGSRLGLTAGQMAEHPHALIGSVAQICETLQARRELYGISYTTVAARSAEMFAPVVAALANT